MSAATTPAIVLIIRKNNRLRYTPTEALPAGPAVSYGLGQGATMVAALWGVFVWREFASAPAGTGRLLTLMFVLYAAGLALLIAAR